ncbi:MAG: ATP-dependent Clp protease adaptor ClpS, partial [Cyanobacteriota bacterium]|nr:ATP-dependent Clp protease adaptor ClpS [Cyanobacteriota bacterium]
MGERPTYIGVVPIVLAMAVNAPSPTPGGAAVLEKQTERIRKQSPHYK